MAQSGSGGSTPLDPAADAGPPVFESLRRWALGLRDLGDLASACSATRALCREAGTHAEAVEASRLLAEICEQAGDLDGARAARAHLVDLARRALAAQTTTERRLDLLEELDRLADVARRQEDHWTVLESHGPHGRLAELRELAAVHGLVPSLLTEQCYSLRRAGTAAWDMGSLEEARSLFEERLTMARLVAAGQPDDPRLVTLVAAALADLGAVLARLGDPRAASLLGEELALRGWLDEHHPSGAAGGGAGHRGKTGADTDQHKLVATTLLAQLEQQGALDVTGRLLLTSLRSG